MEADRYDGIFCVTPLPSETPDGESSDELESEDQTETSHFCPVTSAEKTVQTDHLYKEMGYPFVQGLGEIIGDADVDRQMLARTEQRKDPVLRALGDFLENNVMTTQEEIRHWVTIWAPFCSVHEGLLYYGKPDQWVYDRKIVPHQLRQSLLLEYHSLACGGHYAARKTFEALTQKYWWPQMKEDVQQFINDCMNCSTKLGQGRLSAPPMKNLPVPATPNEVVCMDLLSLPRTPRGNHYVMAITDLLTRQAFAYAIPNKEAATVAGALYSHYFVLHGPPKDVITDRGSEFTAAVFKELCRIHGVNNLYTTVLHPAANGVVERFNRILTTFFAKMRDRQKVEWDLHLPGLLMAYNSTYHRAVGMSPHEAAYGYPMRRVSHCILEADPPFMPEGATPSELGVLARKANLKAAEHLVKYNQAAKERFNVDKNELSKFHKGDYIWLLHEQKGKYNRPFTGPWKILKIRDTNAVIERIHPTKLRPESRTAWIGNFTLCRRKDLATTWDGRGRKASAPIPSFPDSFKGRRREFRDALDIRLREERTKRWPTTKAPAKGRLSMVQVFTPEGDRLPSVTDPPDSRELNFKVLRNSCPPPLCGIRRRRQLDLRAVRRAIAKKSKSRSSLSRAVRKLSSSFAALLDNSEQSKDFSAETQAREEKILKHKRPTKRMRASTDSEQNPTPSLETEHVEISEHNPPSSRRRQLTGVVQSSEISTVGYGREFAKPPDGNLPADTRPRFTIGSEEDLTFMDTSRAPGNSNLVGREIVSRQSPEQLGPLDLLPRTGASLWESEVKISDLAPVPIMPGLDYFHWKGDGIKDTPPWVNINNVRMLPERWRRELIRLQTVIFPRPLRYLFPDDPGPIIPIREFLLKRRGQSPVERFAGASILLGLQRLGMNVSAAFEQLQNMHNTAQCQESEEAKTSYREERRVVLKLLELARYWTQLAAGPKLMAFQATPDGRTELYWPPFITQEAYLKALEVLQTPVTYHPANGAPEELVTLTQEDLAVEFHYHYQSKITPFVNQVLLHLWYIRSWHFDAVDIWADGYHPWACGEYYHDDTRGTVRDLIFLPHRMIWEDVDLSNRARIAPPRNRLWETASEQRMLLPGVVNHRAAPMASHQFPSPQSGLGIHPYLMDRYLEAEEKTERAQFVDSRLGKPFQGNQVFRAQGLGRVVEGASTQSSSGLSEGETCFSNLTSEEPPPMDSSDSGDRHGVTMQW